MFSLGVVMHLVLVGRLPFATGVEKTKGQPVFHEVCFGKEVKGINREMIQLIQMFLSKHPNHRPTSAKALECMPNGVRDEQALAKLSLHEVPSAHKHASAGSAKSLTKQPQMSRIQRMRSFRDSLLHGKLPTKTGKTEELKGDDPSEMSNLSDEESTRSGSFMTIRSLFSTFSATSSGPSASNQNHSSLTKGITSFSLRSRQ